MAILFFLRRFAIAAALLLAGGTATVQAGDEAKFPWDFNGDRLPSVFDVPRAEADNPQVRCEIETNRLFQYYLETYPRFAAIADRERARREWRRAMLLGLEETGDDVLGACFYDRMYDTVDPFISKGLIGRIPYCPHDGLPQDRQFREALGALAELTEYAVRGHVLAIVPIMVRHGPLGMRVKPDIRYLIKLQLIALGKRYGLEKPPYSDESYSEFVFESQKELTPMRREFLDQAFERRDWQAVFDTIDPCAPELETSRS